MDWFKRYKVCFQSILLNKYAVYIYEQTEGELVELIGSDVPFETSESDDNNIFLPIRSQTGYLRIIDTTANGSILEDLMPNNNTEKLVRLYLLDHNGNDKVLCWSGFLQAQAFTQPWGNEIKQVEFPVISVLAAMNDISIQESDFTYQHNIAWYIAQGFTQIGEKPEMVKIICNLENVSKDFLNIFIETSAFFSREEQQNDNVTETKYVGSSYLEILEKIGMLYGFCFRMKNNILYIAMYDDSNGRLAEFDCPWVLLEKIANGSSITLSPGNVGNANLLQSVEFFGNNNVTDFNLGKKEAVVKFQIREADDHILELPSAPENDGDSLEVKNIYIGNVFVQPFSPDFGPKASCYFYEFETAGNKFNLVGSSSYKKCLENSVIYSPLFDPYYSKSDHLITGAFLCRWLYQKDESSIPSYTSGLFMNTKYIKEPVSNFGIEDCFTIYSRHEVAIQDGYLHINMRCLNFVRGQLAGDSEKLYFGNYTSIWGQSKETTLYCILTIGDTEWTPDEGWHEKSGNANTFELKFSGENIITNKTTEMNVDESSGFFIPTPSSGLTGKLTFRICNTAKCIEPPDVAYYDSHSRIITDFSIEFLRTINPLETRRGNNTYRKTIVQFGFSDVAEIELKLGTDNNNKPSDAFIKLDTKNHVETLSYPDSEGKIRKQRPEMNLLGRMFEFYKVIRRSFIGIINSNNTDDLYSRRFEYLGKKFFAVEKSRNWRDEKTECKFIEV